jgi:hypothetical protein
MLTSALVSLFIGALLSRFKAFILFPVFFLTLLIAIGAAVVRADAVLTVVATAVVTIIGLQMGYLLGAVMRHAMLRARESSLRPTSPTS